LNADTGADLAIEPTLADSGAPHTVELEIAHQNKQEPSVLLRFEVAVGTTPMNLSIEQQEV
jgi:hypothetical protein